MCEVGHKYGKHLIDTFKLLIHDCLINIKKSNQVKVRKIL